MSIQFPGYRMQEYQAKPRFGEISLGEASSVASGIASENEKPGSKASSAVSPEVFPTSGAWPEGDRFSLGEDQKSLTQLAQSAQQDPADLEPGKSEPSKSGEAIASLATDDAAKSERSPKEPSVQGTSIDAFAPFIPAPQHNFPSKSDFYISEIKANLPHTMRVGSDEYREALKEDSPTRSKAILMTAATAAGLTVFRHLRRTATFALLMIGLGKPIMIATQTFPEMSRAYDELKRGNPSQAQDDFRNALDVSFYSIFKDFLKPVSYGVMLAYALELPFTFLNEGNGVRHNVIRKIADFLRIKRNAAPVVFVHKLLKPFVYWGDRQADRLRNHLFIFDWIEDPQNLEKTRALFQKRL